ncbi:MFS transporter [Thioclava sp. 'Guangxiensis']|uniref:MFS transporter n=1 Tax=Thioclava sp. 'Guangxiensis' TaxID=3149044 RepID=UPI0038781EB9
MHRLRENILPLTIAFALLMELIDATILSTALPVMARDLDVAVLSLKMAMTTYLIAFAAFVPVSGWIADRFGARRVFLSAMSVFIGASALCAMQSDLGGLVAARALQGLGAAMMTPVGRLIVLRNTDRKELVRAMVYLTAPALLGPALGPFIGALVTQSLGWRWIFLINIPLGSIALILAARHLPRDLPADPVPFDITGFILSAIGLAAIMAGLSSLGEHIMPMPAALGLSVTGFGLMVLYTLRARGRSDALLDPRLFRHRTFSIGIWGGTAFRLSNGAIALLLPLLFQLGLGMSILASGALAGLTAIGALSIRGFSGRVVDRFGFRPVLIFGTFIRAASLLGFGTISSPTDWYLVPLLLTGGVAQALTFTAINAITFADLPPEEMSKGASLSAVAQQMSLTLGIALAGGALELSAYSLDLTISNSLIPLHAFALAFALVAVTGPIAILVFSKLRPEDGAALRHKDVKPRLSTQH